MGFCCLFDKTKVLKNVTNFIGMKGNLSVLWLCACAFCAPSLPGFAG